MARITLPRDLYFGKDSLAELKYLKGKKAIIVAGGGYEFRKLYTAAYYGDSVTF